MTSRIAAILAGFLLTLAASPAIADTAPLGGAMLARSAIGLLLVVALIFACAWAARRFGFAARASGVAPMKVVGSLALGPRDRVVMLEVDGTWLVVGVNAGGMQTLHSLPAQPQPAASPVPDLANSFQQLLRKRLGKTSARTGEATDNPTQPSS